MDKYLCDWGSADCFDLLAGAEMAVGGILNSVHCDGCVGTGGGVVSIYDWQWDTVLGL